MHVWVSSHLFLANVRVHHLLGNDAVGCRQRPILRPNFTAGKPFTAAMFSTAFFLANLVVEFTGFPLT